MQCRGGVVVQLAPDKLWQLEQGLLGDQPDLSMRPQEAACKQSAVSHDNDSLLGCLVTLLVCQEYMQDDAPQ